MKKKTTWRAALKARWLTWQVRYYGFRFLYLDKWSNDRGLLRKHQFPSLGKHVTVLNVLQSSFGIPIPFNIYKQTVLAHRLLLLLELTIRLTWQLPTAPGQRRFTISGPDLYLHVIDPVIGTVPPDKHPEHSIRRLPTWCVNVVLSALEECGLVVHPTWIGRAGDNIAMILESIDVGYPRERTP